MLHSIPAAAPPAPCFTLGRAACGPFTVGYAAFDASPLPHRLLPLNFPALILDFDTGRTLLTGPRARSSLDGPTTWGSGISVGLTPAGAATLAGMPISEISGQSVALDLPWASHLAALPSWPARFTWLDTTFTPAPAAAPDSRPALGSSPDLGLNLDLDPHLALPAVSRWSPSPAVTAAWWRLQQTPRVRDVAAALGLSRRRLERDFRREIGLSPGAVARTARLQRSLSALLRGAPPAAAALTGGFADQSHLTRTMREAVGLTPAAFRAFVQDVAPPVP
ncbi:helix-turn-helix domain-containing protein [Actinoplanes sp. NPDC051343]|uniref:helix-turn-helix transcriptional regulator n=1 Tax=Actinoplanes sp. NPDC051343 TaxID=3363906 RepID=UPI0037B608E8